MSKKRRVSQYPDKIYPKTNLSKAYYRHLVNNIEHDPLVRHSTLVIACMIAAICILLGVLMWFAKINPGNLITTGATITHISQGKTHSANDTTTFVIFDFKTREGEQKTVRQQVKDGLTYEQDQTIRVGYHPKNPNYARILHDNRPPQAALYLWAVPFAIMLWFVFVALLRYQKRQRLIWAAAEAADIDDDE